MTLGLRRPTAGITAGALAGVVPVRAAAAHGTHLVEPDTLWQAWHADPLVIAPLVLMVWLYGRGLPRVRARSRRSRIVLQLRAVAFSLGVAVLLVALVSPLEALGAMLLSAHMAQHGLLVAVAPPLLLLGGPGVALAWGLPPRWRKELLTSAAWRWMVMVGDALSRPMPAAALHGLALWIWHAPAAFDAAVVSDGVHALEHATFFGTAILFWRAILGARSSRRASLALGAGFATLVHGGLLGALITLAPYPLYASYHGRTEVWGSTPLEDQQLAGLFMWVPMGIVYLAACVLLASRLFEPGAGRLGAVSDAALHRDQPRS